MTKSLNKETLNQQVDRLLGKCRHEWLPVNGTMKSSGFLENRFLGNVVSEEPVNK